MGCTVCVYTGVSDAVIVLVQLQDAIFRFQQQQFNNLE